MIGGAVGIILAPISYLISFKLILGTSFVGAFFLGILSLFGYFMMAKIIGGGFSLHEEPKEKIESQTSIFLDYGAKQLAMIKLNC